MFSDFRFAARQLTKSPGFLLIATLTLALGIGLNTSMFSLMNLLVLQPLPYPDRDHLVRIHRTTPQSATAEHTAPDCAEIIREAAPFADVAAYRLWGYTLTPDGRPPVNLNAIRASGNFFSVLGMKPALGRVFNADEDRPDNNVVVLSNATWQAQFGGDPAVIGSTVRIDGQPTVIIGVMPEAFSSVFLWGPGDVFRPMGMIPRELEDHDSATLRLLARTHSDLTLGQLNTRLATLAERLAKIRPIERSKDGLHAVTLQSTTSNPGTVGLSLLLLGLAGFVLLIACANLANLQLARSIARTHEFAIRAALGASRSRLLRPLLCESILLSLLGGALGVLVALWSNDWISSRLSSNGYVKFTLFLDWRVLGFALGLSVITGIFFGLAPAWLMTRIRVYDTLKGGSRGHTGDRTQHRLRHSLIVAQFALALTLLAGAGFFLRGLDRMFALDSGWEHHALTQAVLNLPQAKYSTPGKTYAFYTQLQERLGALPGVESVAVGWTLPIFQFLTNSPVVAEGQEPPAAGHEPVSFVNGITPSFLGTLKINLLSGRNFTEADNLTSQPVVIINESLAKALFPKDNPIGHRIGGIDPKTRHWYEIVGVVPDFQFAVRGIAPATRFVMLRPLAQETWNYVSVAVRSRSAEAMVEPLRQTIAALDPDLAIQQLSTVDQLIKTFTNGFSMVSTILNCFALLGLFLSALGLYGVIARLVVQRTPEIGVRLALGAQSRDVVWLILSSGLRLILWGTGFGLLGAVGLVRLLSVTLPALPLDYTLTFAGVTLLLLAIGLVACWLPARRATKVDPMVALRAE